jgi:hypothetical protein
MEALLSRDDTHVSVPSIGERDTRPATFQLLEFTPMEYQQCQQILAKSLGFRGCQASRSPNISQLVWVHTGYLYLQLIGCG